MAIGSNKRIDNQVAKGLTLETETTSANQTAAPLSANLVGWFKADAGIFTDAGGTTPAVTNGDLVYVWKDQSGSGNDLSQATSGDRPVLATASRNGRNTLTLSSKIMALAGSVTMNACSIYVVAKDNTGSSIWVSNGDDTTSYLYTSNIVRFKSGAGTQVDTAVIPANQWHMAQGRTDGTTCYSFHNTTASAAQANTDDFVWKAIGKYSAAALINASIAEILIYSDAHSDPQMTQIRDYLNARWAIY